MTLRFNKDSVSFPKTDVSEVATDSLKVYNTELLDDVRNLTLPDPFEFSFDGGSIWRNTYIEAYFSNMLYRHTTTSSYVDKHIQTIKANDTHVFVAGTRQSVSTGFVEGFLTIIQKSDGSSSTHSFSVSSYNVEPPKNDMLILDNQGTYLYIIINTDGIDTRIYKRLLNGSAVSDMILTDSTSSSWANNIAQDDTHLYVVGIGDTTSLDGQWFYPKTSSGSTVFVSFSTNANVELNACFSNSIRAGKQGTDTFLKPNSGAKQIITASNNNPRVLRQGADANTFFISETGTTSSSIKKLAYRPNWKVDALGTSGLFMYVGGPSFPEVLNDFKFRVAFKTNATITTGALSLLSNPSSVSFIYYSNGTIYVYNVASSRIVVSFTLAQIKAYELYDIEIERSGSTWTAIVNKESKLVTQVNPLDSLDVNVFIGGNRVVGFLGFPSSGSWAATDHYLHHIELSINEMNMVTFGFQNTTTPNDYTTDLTNLIVDFPRSSMTWTSEYGFDIIEKTDLINSKIDQIVHEGNSLFVTARKSGGMAVYKYDDNLALTTSKEWTASYSDYNGLCVNDSVLYTSVSDYTTEMYVAKMRSSDLSFEINEVTFDLRFSPLSIGGYADNFEFATGDAIPVNGECRVPIVRSEVRNSIIRLDNGYKDFLRYDETPPTQMMYTYTFGAVGGGYDYNSETGEFEVLANGRYHRGTSYLQVQSISEEFDIFFDTINMSFDPTWSGDVEDININVFIKAGVSHSKAEIFFTQDSNYAFPDSGLYQRLGYNEETSAFSNDDIYFTGSKQVELKETPTDARTGRSFKIRIKQRLTDDESKPMDCVDDVKIFNLKILSSEMLMWEGSDNA